MEKQRDEIIQELNRLMAEEVEAFLRYFLMRYRLKGVDRLTAGKFFDEALKETLEHAEAIAKMVRSLGRSPQLSVKLAIGGERCTLSEALQETLDVERQALEAYKEMLPKVAGDPVLEDFIRRQISVETEHCQEIAQLLE